jgi:dUTP pyrophosphatase
MDNKKNQKYIKFVIDGYGAIAPTKAHPLDIGYDLTAISVYKKISQKITLFETGIKVCPPEGYYLEILPRSSITKTGYMLANSVGTIDPTYTGTLKIALVKVDYNLPDITLPFTKCQLVLRKAEQADMLQVFGLEETVRGEGGFGSTDKTTTLGIH